ncbi:hypothetical protein [Amphibacillus jilinensis]|uniref:hypothetical protein n=1 Tax=Amphibacillus jilinensis TaxID=1216008 RepID=UPI0002E02BFA|nr:hypothetical protein [Amphibacillus jilinensis]
MMTEYDLKPVSVRQLKNGMWIVLAEDTTPLVVDEAFARALTEHGALSAYDDALSILKDNGFYKEVSSEIKSLPKEPSSLNWKISMYLLFIIGLMSAMVAFILTAFNGLFTGIDIMNAPTPVFITIPFIIIFSLATTLVHEFMHVVFARSHRSMFGGIRLKFLQAKAYVSMTHIWVWPLTARLAALSAGLVFDFFLLASLLIIQLFTTNGLLATAISIQWLRITWQFRFHKNCDGQLMALSILDNPTVAIEKTDHSIRDVRMWRRFEIIGHLVNLFIFIYWIFPLLWMLTANLFNFFS